MGAAPVIPDNVSETTLHVGTRSVSLTNLHKLFFAELGIRKVDLLRYYAAIAAVLLPHVAGRPMVMKRYPNGAGGEFFFMKRTPAHAPPWLRTCSVEHGSGNVIAFPVIDDVPSLLWIVNAGCIDLNPWYARCDDVHRPDYLHFDLDPVKGRKPAQTTPFATVRESALVVREALERLGLPAFAKTSGSAGIHVYVPIVRGPVQHDVWRASKAIALAIAQQRPDILTAEYSIAKRPAGRVLIDYNQNAWGRTLAGVYSVRPRFDAAVSAPVSWDEVASGIEIGDFRIDTMVARVAEKGDLWKPLLAKRGRADIAPLIEAS